MNGTAPESAAERRGMEKTADRTESAAKRTAVLLSSYNGERFIREQIESILAQENAGPVDLYVRDDASSDGTCGIVRELMKAHENLFLIEGAHAGSTESFFSLLHAAQDYDYYALSDQDDVWLPDKLSSALAALSAAERAASSGSAGEDAAPAPLLYACTSYLADPALRKSGHISQIQRRAITFYNTAVQNICMGHNQVMNRALRDLLTSMPLDSGKIYAHDMWITQTASAAGTILFDNTPHTLYRQHEGNELGFGTGPASWARRRFERAKSGETEKIARQTAYFVETMASYLSEEEIREAKAFLSARSFPDRLRLAIRTKFYRQKKTETVLFRLLYLFGGYRA